MFTSTIDALNRNNYFIGIMMILLNIGSKYYSQEFGRIIDWVFSMKIMRRLMLFTVFFVATRDIKTSLILTAVFIVLAFELFNEKSNMCILPKSLIDHLDKNKDGFVSKEEIAHAITVLKRSGHVGPPNQIQHPLENRGREPLANL